MSQFRGFMALSLLLLFFQNCEQVSSGDQETFDYVPFRQPSVEETIVEPEDSSQNQENTLEVQNLSEESQQKSCDTTPLTEKIVRLAFPPTLGCNFGLNENLPAASRRFQAQSEQTARFTTPENSELCAAQVSFDEGGFLYDDAFVLHVDGNILASSYDFQGIFSIQNGFLSYDWNTLKGSPFQFGNREITYCHESSTGGSECSFGRQNQFEVMSLAFSNESFLNSLKSAQNSHEMSLLTFGDNEVADCRHSGLSARVSLFYYQP